MHIKIKKYSLARDYFIIFGIIISVIIALSLWYTKTIYDSRQELKYQALDRQSNQVSRELTASFDYVSHLMKFMGDKILEGDPKDLKRIAGMLQGKLITGEAVRKQFSWAMFDWSRKDKKIIVTTPYGVMKNPIDISHRRYAKMAPIEPWTLHFDAADVGVTSGQWIIPAGMGIADIDGNFVGTISMGFNVSKLSANIGSAIDSIETSFVVLDANNKVALHSSDYKLNNLSKDFFQKSLTDKIIESGTGMLSKPIENGDIVYSYYSKLDGYPFTVLMGHNKVVAAKEFKEVLLPGVLGYTIIGAIALLLLLALRSLIIKPVINLSEAADKISRGEHVKKIRGCYTVETRNLALQMVKMRRLLKKEQEAKVEQERFRQHEELLKIMRDSDIEKESFIRDMNHALREPLNAIINGAEIIRKEMFGSLTIENYGHYLDAMYDAGKQLETYTTNFLNPSEVEIADIIEKCIVIKRKHAVESKQKLILHNEKNIPPINADRLRLRQIILSTLYHAISYTMPNGIVKINSEFVEAKDISDADKLVITIQDNGLGLDEKERTEFWKTRSSDPSSYTRNPEMDRLSLPVIRHLVQLHHGSFEVISKKRVGTTFIISLPYLSIEELDNNSSEVQIFENDDLEQDDNEIDKDTNIINFPKNKD